MFFCKLAEINVCFENRYYYLYKQCKDYIFDGSNADIKISVSDEEIEKEKSSSEGRYNNAYFEYISAYRKLCGNLTNFNAFLIHGAFFSVDDVGVIFCAPSGTGKTTHMILWKNLLKESMKIINGDKPIVRFIDDIPYGFGTPWCGKEHFGTNDKAQLKHICFIERNNSNSVEKIDKQKALSKLLQQIMLPMQKDEINQFFCLIDKLINKCEFWIIRCNTQTESATVSYNNIFSK